MLDTQDQQLIGTLLANMSRYSLNRPILFYYIMSELAKVCEMKGPCSIVRMTKLTEPQPRIIGKPAHINLNFIENVAHRALWFRYIKSGNIPIFRAIISIQKQRNSPVNFADGEELIQHIQYGENDAERSYMYERLAKNFRIKGLGYLWLTLEDGYDWAICLRKRNDEPAFRDQDVEFLKYFGYAALGCQQSWYVPTFDQLDAQSKFFKDKLTDRQFHTLYYLGRHHSRKECARLMGVSRATIDRNVENILSIFREHSSEFDGKNIAQILYVLNQQLNLDGV